MGLFSDLLGLAGAGIGFLLAGPWGAALGMLAGTFIGALFDPKPDGPKPQDTKVTTSTYGRVIPVGYGTTEYGANIVWLKGGQVDFRTVKKKVKGGGLFSGLFGGNTVEEIQYIVTIACGFCEGPGRVLKIFFDDKLIYDATNQAGPLFAKLGYGAAGWLFYDGGEGQVADPVIEANDDPDKVPAFRGLIGFRVKDFPLDDFGPRPPSRIQAVIARDPTQPFPTWEVEPTIGATGALMLWQADGVLAIPQISASTALLVQIHGSSRAILGEFTVDHFATGAAGPTLFSVDQFGDIYGTRSDNTLESVSHLFKFDGVTGAFIASTPIVYGTPPIIIGSLNGFFTACLVLGLPGAPQNVLCFRPPDGSATGEYALVRTVQNDADELPIVMQADLQDLYDLSPAGNWCTLAAAMASDGDGWLIAGHSGTDSLYLFEIQRFSGLIVQGPLILAGVSWVSFGQAIEMGYDAANNSLLILDVDNDDLYRWSLDSQTIEASNTSLVLATSFQDRFANAMRQGSTNGRLYIHKSTTTFYEIDTATLTTIEHANSSWGLGALDYGLYDPTLHAFVREDTTNNDFHWMLLDRAAPAGTTLRSIVEDVCDICAYDVATEIDATELTDLVAGYQINARGAGRRGLEPLAAIYHFDCRDEDFKLDFPKRGAAPVAAIPADGVTSAGAGAIGEEPQPVERGEMIDELQLPQRVDINYINPDRDYEVGTEPWQRTPEAVETRHQVTIDASTLVLSADAAAQALEIIMRQLWLKRHSIPAMLPPHWLRLSAGDTITQATPAGLTWSLVIQKRSLRPDFVLELETVTDDPDIYTSDAVGGSSFDFVPARISAVAIVYRAIDAPAVSPGDYGPAVYHAAAAIGADPFTSVAVSRFSDGAMVPAASIDDSTMMGRTMTALPDVASPWVWDRTSVLTVRVWSGPPVAATEDQILDDPNRNLLIVGAEYIQFATVADNGDGTYNLSLLLRGCFGTEHATLGHAAGEMVAAVALPPVVRVALATGLVGTEMPFEAVAQPGGYRASDLLDPFLGAMARPLAPVLIEGARDGSLNLTVSFQRRDLLRGFVPEQTGIGLGQSELDLAFKIEIMGGSPVGVLRTISTATESAVYTAAQQTTDFGSAQPAVDVVIYQAGALIARGFEVEATV